MGFMTRTLPQNSPDTYKDSGQRPVEQRHKAYITDHPPGETVLFAHDQHQLLHLAGTHRDHQAPARGQLVEQCLRHISGYSGDDNAVVRRQRRPALPPIAPAEHHVAQVKLKQPLLGPVLQHLDALYRKNPFDQLREYGGLVPRTGADLHDMSSGPSSSNSSLMRATM